MDVIQRLDLACECCGQTPGWIYSGTVYSVHGVDNVCPWCIADGSAHRKWNASFCQDIEADSNPDARHGSAYGVAPEVVDEVMHRTPGYTSWQGAIWRTHCGDVCEFHGDISAEELSTLTPASEALFRADFPWLAEDEPSLAEFVERRYAPKGDLSIYKFVCRHCGIVRLHADMS